MIALDSSALIAILRGEAEASRFLEAIASASALILSAVSYLETSIVLAGPAGGSEVWKPLDRLIARTSAAVVGFDAEQAAISRAAFLQFGKGRHAASLNFGDCASYALAKSRKVPLLFKGDDFRKT